MIGRQMPMTESADAPARSRDMYWHFDKTAMGLIAGLIVAVVLQTGSFIWWASGVTHDVQEQGRRIAAIELSRAADTQTIATLASMGARLDYIERMVTAATVAPIITRGKK